MTFRPPEHYDAPELIMELLGECGASTEIETDYGTFRTTCDGYADESDLLWARDTLTGEVFWACVHCVELLNLETADGLSFSVWTAGQRDDATVLALKNRIGEAIKEFKRNRRL